VEFRYKALDIFKLSHNLSLGLAGRFKLGYFNLKFVVAVVLCVHVVPLLTVYAGNEITRAMVFQMIS
jgi:hypothetical protein